MTDSAGLLPVGDGVRIPRSELRFRATRSGGPGGQHVNTSSTRVELEWDAAASPSLSEAQRARVLERLANRTDKEGVLRLVASEERSQHRNREAAVERFRELLAAALHVPKRRRKTRPTRASREKRLRSKRQRAQTKRQRGQVRPEE